MIENRGLRLNGRGEGFSIINQKSEINNQKSFQAL